MSRPWTDVVAAVIYQPDGSYLLAQRPPGKAYAGYWEFPGGKVEPGESLDAAIKREIREELGIEIQVACPWITRTHVYEHAAVRLHFFRTREWRGTPQGLEAQRFAFVQPGAEMVGPMLPANGPVLNAMALPHLYGVTNAGELGVQKFMQRLGAALTGTALASGDFVTSDAVTTASTKGLRLVQVREPTMTADQLRTFAAQVIGRCQAHGARCLINGDAALAAASGADGIHLPARQLMQTRTRPAFDVVGASVHTRAELDHASAIGCDFAVLGPVLPTATHPGAATLGWNGFAAIARDAQIPVHAIGGMRAADAYPAAWQAGAHGVAMLRAAWA